MKNFIRPKVALCMVFFFLFSLIGCGGGGSSDGDSQTAALQEHLTSFNSAMDWVAEDMVDLMETVDQLNTAMAEDDGSSAKTSEIGGLVDQFALDADNLVIDVETMDLAEAGIQEIINPESLNSVGIIAIVGAGLVIKGLYEFGKKMAQKSDDMIEARKNRDKAADDLMNGVQGAEEGFSDAKKEMTDIGGDVIEELATKVTTELVLSPLNPTSLTGVILKDAAGNKVQDGLKVLSATKECEEGYDSPGCKIGIDEIDEADSAVVPDGDTTIVVGGKDMAREVIKKDIPPGSYTEITIDQTPVKDVSDEMIPTPDIPDNFDGTYFGTVVVLVTPEGICYGGDLSMEVSGSSISGDGAIGTVDGNAVSFAGGDWVFSGTITNNVMSGTWYDTVDPCSGTFSFTKQ